MAQRVIILKGLIASGKTTWAKEQVKKNPGVYKRINKDDLRAMLDCSHHTDYNEQFILEMRDTMILKALDYGKSVLVDDTNFEPKHEIEIRSIVEDWNGQQKLYGKKGNATIEIKFFDLPLEECIERDAGRKDSVGKKVIMEMYNKYLKPKEEKALPKMEWYQSIPSAIICDIDGTLALHPQRSHYDYSKVIDDEPNGAIPVLMRKLEGSGNENLILVSGREDSCREVTEIWLKKWLPAKYIHLYMRESGDFRPDDIIKKEIFEKYIHHKYNIWMVFDDRDRCVKMWRELGLTCLQVAEGNF